MGLVLCLGWDNTQKIPTTQEERAAITFILADATYTRGYGASAAIAEKQDKYAHLVPHLRARGFKVIGFKHTTCTPVDPRARPAHLESDYSSVGVLCFGVTGEVFESSKPVLAAFGLTSTSTVTLLGQMHIQSIREALSILSTRRKMDLISKDAQAQGQTGASTNRHPGTKTNKRKRTTDPATPGHKAAKTPRRGIG